MNSLFKEINMDPTLKERRKFGLLLLVGFPIAGLIWLLILLGISSEWRPSVFYVFASVGLGLGSFAALVPQLSRPLYITWHCLTKAIELSISYILLAILFFLVVTPIGLIRRRHPNTPIVKGFQKDKDSYWRDVAKPKSLSQYYRQF